MTFIVGHIRNRRATKGERSAEPPADAGVHSRAPGDFAELDAALEELRALGVNRLAINGGDGTVREVLSRAPEIWAGAPLDFAIVPNGNTNLIARKTGGVAVTDLGALKGETLKRFTMQMIRVERSGERILRGFIMGAGAYEKVTAYAQEEIETRHGAQVAAAVVRLLLKRSLRAPEPIGFGRDGGPCDAKPRTLVAFSTLPGALIAGLEPFWGEGDGPIRWLEIGPKPPFLALAAPFVALGKPRGWMRGQYRSGRLSSAVLTIERDFVLEGERFAPGADGRVRVSAAESATFLSLQ